MARMDVPGAGAAVDAGHPAAPWLDDFNSRAGEWRRVLAEVIGTFFLVIAAAGGAALREGAGSHVSRAAEVTAPGLTVMALILALGAVSGVHLNPVVSVAFALRREFPWRRVPGYVAAQVAGGLLAGGCLRLLLGAGSTLGASTSIIGLSAGASVLVEAVLTFGLVTVILGTASSAQNVGHLSAIAVGGYIAAAGLWAEPLTGASMNPARSFGPGLAAVHLGDLWIYLVGPTLGMLLAVAAALAFRGRGGDAAAAKAAQGS